MSSCSPGFLIVDSQYGVAPLGQDRFQHTADDRPVGGVGLDPQRRSTVPAACVDAPAGVAGLVVLGRCFVLHLEPRRLRS